MGEFSVKESLKQGMVCVGRCVSYLWKSMVCVGRYVKLILCGRAIEKLKKGMGHVQGVFLQ